MISTNEDKIKIDLACAVVTHKCSKKCSFCVDNFLNTSDKCLNPETLDRFIKMLLEKTNWEAPELFNKGKKEVLFLGGEPTEAPIDLLKEYGTVCKNNGVLSLMSTNGIRKDVIESLLPYYDWMQISIFNEKDLEYWSKYENTNAKLVIDQYTTYDKLMKMIDDIHKFGYKRSTITVYTDNFGHELNKDKQVIDFLNSLDYVEIWHTWFSFYEGIRIKRPTIINNKLLTGYFNPILYPNGNYNGDWRTEELDDYIPNSNWIDNVKRCVA